MSPAWKKARRRLGKVGTTYNDGKIELVEIVDGKRFVFARTATGSQFKVTAQTLDRVWATVEEGGSLAKHAAGPDGISYTSGIEAMVVRALNLKLSDERKWTK